MLQTAADAHERDATVFQFFHLFHQRGRRQHNTVTDDAGYILAENT